YGQRTEPQRIHPRQVLLGLRKEVDTVGAVELDGDRLDLRTQRRAVGREEPEVVRLLARLHDGVRQVDRAVPSQRERAVHDHALRAGVDSEAFDQLDLGVRVGGEVVDRYHARQPVAL